MSCNNRYSRVVAGSSPGYINYKEATTVPIVG